MPVIIRVEESRFTAMLPALDVVVSIEMLSNILGLPTTVINNLDLIMVNERERAWVVSDLSCNDIVSNNVSEDIAQRWSKAMETLCGVGGDVGKTCVETVECGIDSGLMKMVEFPLIACDVALFEEEIVEVSVWKCMDYCWVGCE
ncbi:hypothetical protein Salat_0519400 [Sesamum alatum]|uniref:Uncharacterized protein n=1 Tax=Sesamum alatum TaxID=300844 RepID=A0AAE2D140_9LAMI|nr:hypothetical protein Salat_0519400 [Sesamum alatum]